MAFTSDQLAKLTRDASSEPQTAAAATWGQRLIALDLAAVHLFSRTARSALGKFLAVAISKLGNGWIYRKRCFDRTFSGARDGAIFGALRSSDTCRF